MNNTYEIKPASAQDFGLYSAVYKLGRTNVWFPTSIARYEKMFAGFGNAHWLLQDGAKAGIFLMENNEFGFLSLIPPYDDEWSAVKSIVQLLKKPGTPLTALSVDKSSFPIYQRLGFQMGTAEKCMIRPTEAYAINWGSQFTAKRPVQENIDEMSDLALDAYGKSTLPALTKLPRKYFQDIFSGLFSPETPDLMQSTSTIVRDSASGELAGLCTMEFWEELPCIAQLAVKPKYQGQGLAKLLLQQALTDLHPHHRLVRLWVQTGNSAEALYHQMGFLAGSETCDMILNA